MCPHSVWLAFVAARDQTEERNCPQIPVKGLQTHHWFKVPQRIFSAFASRFQVNFYISCFQMAQRLIVPHDHAAISCPIPPGRHQTQDTKPRCFASSSAGVSRNGWQPQPFAHHLPAVVSIHPAQQLVKGIPLPPGTRDLGIGITLWGVSVSGMMRGCGDIFLLKVMGFGGLP